MLLIVYPDSIPNENIELDILFQVSLLFVQVDESIFHKFTKCFS
uniref:Uncharacterized protein n=1 Tax=Schistosoma curassoni TaxID=6186 RepID=A0A183JES7_9TREM